MPQRARLRWNLVRVPRDLRAAALLTAAFTIVTRLPTLFLSHPIDDEATYGVVAMEILRGGRPYVSAIERKPPLLFWTYAAVFRAGGAYNWLALHAVAIAWVLGTMLGLYAAGRRLFDKRTALVAALLYSLYQPWGTWKNVAFNGEVMMLLPVVWAWAIAFDRKQTRSELLACGALLCLGFLLKQPAAGVAAPVGLYLIHRSLADRRALPGIRGVGDAAILTAGFFGTLVTVAAILWHEGILAEAYYWTIADHALDYVFWNRAVLHTLAFAAACLPLLLGAGAALADGSLWRERRSERFALICWLLAAAIGAAAGGRFYPHYYIGLIPPLALLAAPAMAPVLTATARFPGLPPRRVLKGWLAGTAIAFFLADTTGLAIEHRRSAAAEYLRAHSGPDETIFMWGQDTAVYAEAQRRPASRYIATFPLTGQIFGPRITVDTSGRILPGAWETLGHDLQNNCPLFVVDTEAAPAARYPVWQFPMMEQLLAERYVLVDRADDGDVYERAPGESCGP